jgi:hypothetical protein
VAPKRQRKESKQMMRNLKALGLALVAVVALGAIVAQAAQAKFDTITTFPTEPAIVKVAADPLEKPQVFTAVPGGFSVTCQKVSTVGGTVTDKATEVTGEPRYEECKNSLGGEATVNSNGCHYKFTSETNASEHAEVHLICGSEATEPKGAGITISTAGATLTIGTQTLRGVHYTNETTSPGTSEREMHITLSATVEKSIHYTCSPAFTCGIAGIPTTGTEATYKGKATVTGVEDIAGQEGPNKIGLTVSTRESEEMP